MKLRTEEQLLSLVTETVAENRTIEFKRDLIGRSDADAKEFLADVSSLANAQGGTLVIGVEDAGGVAVSVPGIAVADCDAEKARLENMLRDGLEPRLPAVELHWINLTSGRACLVLDIGQSFAAPHRVKFKDHAKFYGRNSAGKYPMDTFELRLAFLASDNFDERIRRTHEQFVEEVLANDIGVPLSAMPKAVVTCVPHSAIYAAQELDLTLDSAVKPVGVTSLDGYPSLEGFRTYSTDDRDGTAYTVATTNRRGWTQAVFDLRLSEGGGVYIDDAEVRIYQAARSGIDCLTRHEVSGPFVVLASLLRVRGSEPRFEDSILSVGRPPAYPRDRLNLPTLTVDDAQEPTLRPMFGPLWNAYGYTRRKDRRIGNHRR